MGTVALARGVRLPGPARRFIDGELVQYLHWGTWGAPLDRAVFAASLAATSAAARRSYGSVGVRAEAGIAARLWRTRPTGWTWIANLRNARYVNSRPTAPPLQALSGTYSSLRDDAAATTWGGPTIGRWPARSGCNRLPSVARRRHYGCLPVPPATGRRRRTRRPVGTSRTVCSPLANHPGRQGGPATEVSGTSLLFRGNALWAVRPAFAAD